MEIGVLSDSHSRHETVELALQMYQTRKVTTLIHCGDICDSDTIWLFHGFSAHFVFGNCDWERLSLKQAVEGIGERIYEPFGTLTLLDKKIAWTHGDNERLLHELIHLGEYDYVFHGHTHVARDVQVGPTRVINPGALHRANPKTCGILNLLTNTWEKLELPG